MSEWSETDATHALRLARGGWTLKQIAEALGKTRGAVAGLLSRRSSHTISRHDPARPSDARLQSLFHPEMDATLVRLCRLAGGFPRIEIGGGWVTPSGKPWRTAA